MKIKTKPPQSRRSEVTILTSPERAKNMKLNITKEISTRIEKMGYYSADKFISDAKAYTKACKDGRLFCIIDRVSPDGMRRDMRFKSFEPSNGKKSGNYRQYCAFFEALGYKESRRNDFNISVSGCGMDMVFATHYHVIRYIKKCGIITESVCNKLEQQTPVIL